MRADSSFGSVSLENIFGFPNFLDEFRNFSFGNMVVLECIGNDLAHRQIDETMLGYHNVKNLMLEIKLLHQRNHECRATLIEIGGRRNRRGAVVHLISRSGRRIRCRER